MAAFLLSRPDGAAGVWSSWGEGVGEADEDDGKSSRSLRWRGEGRGVKRRGAERRGLERGEGSTRGEISGGNGRLGAKQRDGTTHMTLMNGCESVRE